MDTNQEIVVLGRKIADIFSEIDAIKRGNRASRLGNGNVSIHGSGYIPFFNGDTEIFRVGTMPDGTQAATSMNNPVPPIKPEQPSCTPTFNGIAIFVSGLKNNEPLPYDFSHFNIYVDGVLNGKLYKVPDTWYASPLEYNQHTVEVTSVNQSGSESVKTAIVFATPARVVGKDVTDGIISTLKLANAAVEEAKLAAGAVTNTKIGDNSVDSYKIVANGVQAINIAAGAITTGKLDTNAVTTDKLAANSVTADILAVNSVTAGKIKAGAVTADKLESVLNISTRFIAGNFEMNTNGIIAVNSDGNIAFQVDSTGSVLVMGVYRTAITGNRITINEGGNNTIFLYPTSAQTPRASIIGTGNSSFAGIILNTSAISGGGSLTITPSYIQGSTFPTVGGFFFGNNLVTLNTSGNGTGIIISNNPGPITLLRSATNNTSIQFSNTGLDIYNSVSGSYLAVGASAFVQQSSEEAKENIRPLDFDPIQAIMDAPTKMYEMKDDPETTNIGPIAEQLPDFITMQMDNGVLGVSLDGKIGVVWSATENIIKRLEALENGRDRLAGSSK